MSPIGLRTTFAPAFLLLPFVSVIFSGAFGSLLLAQPNKMFQSANVPSVDLHSAIPNYCNNSKLIEQSGLIRAPMGQFLGFPCSNEFYHCRWQSDGYRTYRKNCRAGLVYDVMGTQNCNYDYNVKGCSMNPSGPVANCTSKDFECPLSEDCVPLAKRCDGNYDCVLEEDEQNCPMCKATHFPCVVSEQCIPLGQRCNGIKECQDGTDELDCENCGAGKFLCRKSGKCIPAKSRCDGFAQCPHGEDEQLCKKSRVLLGPRMFLCENGRHQIPQQNVCDGIVHCPDDASDEKYCQRAITKAPTIEFEVQSPAPMPSQTTQPVAEPRFEQPLPQQKVMAFDPPTAASVAAAGGGGGGKEQQKANKLPAIGLKTAVPQNQQSPPVEEKVHPPLQRPPNAPPMPNFDYKDQQPQQQQPPTSFPRIAFNPGPANAAPPPPFPLEPSKQRENANNDNKIINNHNNNNEQPNGNVPPQLIIQMPILKKSPKTMDPQQLPMAYQFRPQPAQSMSPPVPAAVPRPAGRIFVPGDFQAGVWNGTAYSDQQKNPYAEESWFSQYGQQQIEQNNLVQEEEQQPQQQQWPSIPGYTFQQRVQQQQPLNEQRRAIKEEAKEQPSVVGQPTMAKEVLMPVEQSDKDGNEVVGFVGDQARVGDAKIGAKAAIQQKDAQVGKDGKGEGLAEPQSQQMPQMAMPMPIDASLPIPSPIPSQNPMQRGNGSGETSGKELEEDKNEEVLEVSTEGRQSQQEESDQPTANWSTTSEQIKATVESTESTESEGEMPMATTEQTGQASADSEREEKLLKNAAEKVGQMDEVMESSANPNAEMVAKIKEEEEQRQILKRLYDKFGPSAKDLLHRMENLLLLAENGLLARSGKSEDEQQPAGETQTAQQQQPQPVIRRRQTSHGEMVRQYVAAVMGRGIGDGRKQKKLRVR